MVGLYSKLTPQSNNLIKYIVIGAGCSGMGFFIYSALVFYDFDYQFSNFIGYFLGTLCSFLINRSYNFKIKNKAVKRLFFFFVVAILGYMTSVLSLFLLVGVFCFNELFSKMISLIFVVLIQFTLNKRITFNDARYEQ